MIMFKINKQIQIITLYLSKRVFVLIVGSLDPVCF